MGRVLPDFHPRPSMPPLNRIVFLTSALVAFGCSGDAVAPDADPGGGAPSGPDGGTAAVTDAQLYALATANVRIRSLSGRGSLDDLVVKVELEPSADLPPGTELVRYYRMEYSSITGWRHRGDATALSYYLSLF